MIYFLKGKVKQKGENYLVIETNNLGYQVFVTDFLLNKTKVNQEVQIFIYLYLREETIELYGFEAEEELDFFKQLNAIPGIGPKSAISVLSLIRLSDLKKAILNENSDVLTKVSGIGKKTAERIIVELKSKISKKFSAPIESYEDGQVIEALIKLGYSLNQAREAIRKVPENVKGTKERLKEALKIISR